MNGPFQVAQANIAGQTTGKPPARIVKIAKPFNEQSVVVALSYDGSVKADLSAIAGEKITLVHVGEKLIILFDNKSTITLEPFFDSTGKPIESLTVEVSPGRDLTGTEFAALFPVTEDQSVLPAAGDGNGNAQASGANFSSVGVDPLALPGPLDLLGQEELPNFVIANLLTPSFINDTPTVTDFALALDEDEIPGVGGNPLGNGDIDAPAKFSGVLPHDFKLDGPGDINFAAMDGKTQTINGITVTFAWDQATHTLIANDGSADVFSIVITGPTTGAYTVTLLNPLHHHTDALADNTEASDVFKLIFTIVDSNDTTADATLSLEINDDTPIANASQPKGFTEGEQVFTPVLDDEDQDNGIQGVNTNGDDGSGTFVSGILDIAPGADGLKAVTFTGLNGLPAVSVVASDNSTVALKAIWVDPATGVGKSEAVDLAWVADGTGGGILTGTSAHFDGQGGHNPVFTLSVDAFGNYTFTAFAPLAHPLTTDGVTEEQTSWEDNLNLAFTYTAVDGDGDKTASTLTINVDDDTPVAYDTVPVFVGEGTPSQVVSLDDESQNGGNNAGGPGDDNDGNSVSGVLNFAPGADGVKQIAFAEGVTVTADDNSHPSLKVIFVNGSGLGVQEDVTLTWTADASGGGTLTGTSAHFDGQGGHNPAFTLSVDAFGHYTFTAFAPLVHPLTSNGTEGQTAWEDNLNLQFTYSVTDGDGDTVSAHLTVNVDDDTPTVIGKAITLTVDEDDIRTAWSQGNHPNDGSSVDGSLTEPGTGAAIVSGSVSGIVSAGADGLASHAYGFSVDTIAHFQSLHLFSKQTALPENGLELTYQITTNGNLSILTAYEPDTPGPGNTGNPVFSFTLDTTSGDFTFRLFDELIHMPGGADGGQNFDLRSGGATDGPGGTQASIDHLDFGSIITVTDGDGDMITLDNQVNIKIRDDVPEAHIDLKNGSVTVDETPGYQNDDTNSSSVRALFAAFENSGIAIGDDPHVSGDSNGLGVAGNGAINYARSDFAVVGNDSSVGADSPPLANTFSLAINGGAASGLFTTDGSAINLSLSNGLVIGTVVGGQFAGQVAFAVAIEQDGRVSVAQYLSLKHPDSPNNYDESVSLSGKINAVLTVTDSDGDTSTDTVAIGSKIKFEDDGPSVDANLKQGFGVTVDETPGNQNDDVTGPLSIFGSVANPGDDPDVAGTPLAFARSAGSALSVSIDFGSDGGATSNSVVYTLTLSGGNGTNSGLDVTDGNDIRLYKEGNLIVGRVDGGAFNGKAAFAIGIDPVTGQVSVVQYLSIEHPDAPNNFDEDVGISSGKIFATVTVTDGDGDKDSDSVDISGKIRFDDDGPSVTISAVPNVVVSHDETPGNDGDANDTSSATVTNLFTGVANKGDDPHVPGTGAIGFAQSAAALVNVPTPNFGADGPATSNSKVLSLTINGGNNTDSGLNTTEGKNILLRLENGIIVGRVDSNGDGSVSSSDAAAFAIVIGQDGKVSIAQYLSLHHPVGGVSYDEPISIAANKILATVTVTDGDGDKASQSVDISGKIQFQDDGPTVIVNTDVSEQDIAAISLNLDETITSAAPPADRYNSSETESGAGVPNGLTDNTANTTVTLTTNASSTAQFGELQTAAGSLANLFAPAVINYGADGSSSQAPVTSALSLVLTGSGEGGFQTNLVATALAGGVLAGTSVAHRTVWLTLEGGAIVGRTGHDTVGTGDDYVVLRISLSSTDPATAKLIVDQFLPIDHDASGPAGSQLPENPSQFDEQISLLMAGNGQGVGVKLTVTATDGDNDSITQTATANLINNNTSIISFDDDGPAPVSVSTANGAANGLFFDGFVPNNDAWGAGSGINNSGIAGAWHIAASPHEGAQTIQLERVGDNYRGSNSPTDSVMVDLEATPGNIEISQNLTLIDGSLYHLTFEIGAASDPGIPGSAKLEVLWNGVPTGTIYTPTPGLMQTISIDVTAVGTSNQLTFREVGEYGDNTGTFLANVKLSDVIIIDETKEVDADSNDTTGLGALFATVTNGGPVGVDPNMDRPQYAQGPHPVVVLGTPNYGTDGPAATNPFRIALSLSSAGVDSGLMTTEGKAIHLFVEGSIVVGRFDADNDINHTYETAAFALTIDNSGILSIAQYVSLHHPDIHSNDEGVYLAPGTVLATVTLTDGDGDHRTSSADISSSVRFEDDGPRLLGVSGEQGPNLIVNGSFELGHGLTGDNWDTFKTITGWTSGDNGTPLNPNDDVPFEIQLGNVGDMAAQDLSAKLELDSDLVGTGTDENPTTHTNATVQQTIAGTVAGETYELIFWFAPRPNDGPDNSSSFKVLWNGAEVLSVDSTGASSGWQMYKVYVTGAGPNSVLAFQAAGEENSLGAYIDNVSLHSVAILDDEGLSTLANPGVDAVGIAGGPGDDAGVAISTSGNIAFDPGADGLKSITVNSVLANGSALQAIHIDPVTGEGTTHAVSTSWTPVGQGGTLTGYMNLGGSSAYEAGIDDEVFILVVQADGSYTFILKAPLAHSVEDDPATLETETEYEDNLSLAFGFTITDGDDDTVAGTININVDDDTPDAAPDALAMENSSSATPVTASLHFEPGADGWSGASLLDNTPPQGLTQGGNPVHYWVSADGATLIGYTGAAIANGGAGPAAGDQVFTLTVSPGDNSYTLDIIKPLDTGTSETLQVGGSSFGSGPANYQVLTTGSHGTGVEVAVVSGWATGGSFSLANWMATGNATGLTHGSINGSAGGWGVGNNNFTTSEFMRFDFGTLTDFDGASSYTPPAGPVAAATSVTFDFPHAGASDGLVYVVHYSGGGFAQAAVSDPTALLTLTAPVGQTIDNVEFFAQNISGSFKVDLASASVGASGQHIDLSFNVGLTDGDGDTQNVSLAVSLTDPNTPFVQVAGFDGVVEEEQLHSSQANGNEDTTSAAPDIDDDVAGNFDITTDVKTGTLSSLVTGGDGVLTYGFNAVVDGSNVTFAGGGNVTSEGQQVIYDLQGTTLWGFVNVAGGATTYNAGSDRAVFKLELTDTSTGAFKFILLDNIDHHTIANADYVETVKTLDLGGIFKVTDSDSPADSLVFQNVVIRVIDDVPDAKNDVDTVVARAVQTLNFDEAVLGDGAEQPIVSPYHGFNFIQAGAYNPLGGSPYASYAPSSGNDIAFIGEKSGNQVDGYAGNPGDPITIEHTDGSKFTALGAWFSSNGNEPLLITVKGYDENGLVTGTFDVSIHRGDAGGPTYVDFSALGSVHHITLGSPDGQYFGFDDFSYRDDAAVATGNVLTGSDGGLGTDANITDGVADGAGADGLASITWTDAPVAGNVTTIAGLYGTLTIDALGNYSYKLNDSNPSVVHWTTDDAALVETFEYAITDGDGDTDTATLTINVEGADDAVGLFNLTPAIDGGDVVVYETDLPQGSSPNAPVVTLGTFNFAAPDGVDDLTVGGSLIVTNGVVTLPGPISTAYGLLTITGVNLATGTVSYSYTLTGNTLAHGPADNGDNSVFDNVNVTLTDRDGDSASSAIAIKVVDDIPVAVNDANSVTEGLGHQTSGNVFDVTGASANDHADTVGADGAAAGGAVTRAYLGLEANAGSATFTTVAGATVVTGLYGNLTLHADGTYTYALTTALIPVGVTNETFTYEIKDGDGDTDLAQLVISLSQDTNSPDTTGSTATVYEDGLADGVQHGAASETATGTFTVDGNNESYTLTLDGVGGPVTITAANQTVATDKGVLTIASISTPDGDGVVTYGYSYTLSHALIHAGQGEDSPQSDLTDTIAMYVTDATGDSDTTPASIVISIVDDIPVAEPNARTVQEGNIETVDVQFIVDMSGSMFTNSVSNVPGIFADNRAGLARYAMFKLLDGNDQIQNVEFVAFGASGSAAGSVWMTRNDAIAYIIDNSNWGNRGGTDYDLALQTAINSFGGSKPLPAGDQTFVYFLSDGEPVNGAIDTTGTGANVSIAEWESHITSQGIDQVFALGIGAAPAAALNPIAYPKVDTTPTGSQYDNVILVSTANVNDLPNTFDDLLGTTSSVSGNILLNDPSTTTGADGFGADGGHILSITIASGITYTYDPVGNDITASSGTQPPQNTPVLTIQTALGGTFTFYFAASGTNAAGAWTYLTGSPGSENFTYTLRDNDGDLDSSTLGITITPVNEAPAGTSASFTILEDGVHVLTVGDFGFTDPNDTPANGLLAVKITTLPTNGTLYVDPDGAGTGVLGTPVTTGQFVSASDIAAGKLVFVPAANGNGSNYASFNFQVQDNGGTSPGVDLDPTPNTITFNVTAVNDAPSGSDKTVTINEDTPRSFSTADFSFGDASDAPANNLSAVIITTLPTAGTLALSGSPVTVGQSIPIGSIASLVFIPDANAKGNGYASFTFQVKDNGGTADGGIDTDQTPNTFTFNVTPVNDAPSTDLNGLIIAGTGATAAFTEQTSVLIAPSATIIDIDSANLASMTVTLSNRLNGNSVESLSLDPAALAAAVGLTVSYATNTGVLSVVGSASKSTYETILAGILYNNTSDTPNTTNRTVSVVVNDGALNSSSNTVTVGVTAVNDDAVITNAATRAFGTVVEAGGVNNAAAGTPTATGNLDSTDVDNTADFWTVVAAGAATTNGYGTFAVTAAGVWTYSLNNANVAVQGLVAGGTLTDTFTVTTIDGTPQLVTLTINGANDSPVVSNVVVTETAIALNITDPDHTAFKLVNAPVAFATAFGSPTLDGVNSLSVEAQANVRPGTLQVQDDAGATANVIGLYLGTNADNVFDSSGSIPVAIYGFGGNDDLTGGTGADFIFGGDNGDTIRLANGDFAAGEVINGGNGNDTISLTGAVNVNFTTGTVVGVENVLGNGSNNDDVTMSATQFTGFNSINLGNGNSDDLRIQVSGAVDISSASATTISNIENVSINGTGSPDSIKLTGAQMNAILSGTNSNVIDLGDGADTIQLTSTSTTFNGLSNTALVGVETITAVGAAAGVKINVSNQVEVFTLIGSDNADTLIGGTAADILTGNDGADQFRLRTNAGGDTITDFVVGTDKIAFLDSNSTGGGSVNFSNTSGSQLGTGLNASDFDTRTSFANMTTNDDNQVVLITQSGLSSGTIASGDAGNDATNTYVIVYNDDLNRGEIWFDTNWNDIGNRTLVAILNNITLAQLSSITAADIVAYSSAADPIILDLDHNGFAFSSLENGVQFDIKGDGAKDQVAWTNGQDGLLALDLDHSGKIESGSELFTPTFNNKFFADGLAALASLDTNHDGVVDSKDQVFADLVVWQDANHNGVSDDGELTKLGDLGIVSINLDTTPSTEVIDGQSIPAKGIFTYADGTTGSFVEVDLDTSLGQGDGSHTLHGTSGADTFAVSALGAEHINAIVNYNAAEGDKLDLSALLDAVFTQTSNVDNFVHFEQSGNDIKVQVDTTGQGNFSGGAHDVTVLADYGAVSHSDIVNMVFAGTEHQLHTAV